MKHDNLPDLLQEYILQNLKHLVIAWFFGITAIVLGMKYMVTVDQRRILLVIFITNIVLCCPFNLRTLRGRLWWAMFLPFILCGLSAIVLGIHNPLGWLLALISSLAYSFGTCLRFNPLPGERIKHTMN